MITAHISDNAFTDATTTKESVASLYDNQFAQQSSEIAFSSMLEEHSDFAYNVALRMLHKPEDAEDAVQEAFISAYRAFSSFKGQSKLSTWLYRIVVNACLMKIRKEKSQSKYFSTHAIEDAVIPDWSAGPEKQAQNSELQRKIEDGLGQLSPQLRAVVVLRDVQGLSAEEAAGFLSQSQDRSAAFGLEIELPAGLLRRRGTRNIH